MSRFLSRVLTASAAAAAGVLLFNASPATLPAHAAIKGEISYEIPAGVGYGSSDRAGSVSATTNINSFATGSLAAGTAVGNGDNVAAGAAHATGNSTASVAANSTASNAAPRGTAWIDSNLEGAITAETGEIRLQDDFAAAVNRDWNKAATIAPGSEEASTMQDLRDAVRTRKMSLIGDSTLTGHDAEITRAFYTLAADWNTRNAQGVEPLRPYIDAIAGITTLDGLTAYLTDPTRNLNLETLCSFGPSVSIYLPDRYTIDILPTTLLLKDSAEYTGTLDGYGKTLVSVAADENAYLLSRLGYTGDEADQVFRGALRFENNLAPAILPNATTYSTSYTAMTNNYYTYEDLASMQGSFPLTEILAAYGFDGSASYNLTQPQWLAAIGALYNESNLEDMKDYLIVRTALSAIGLLDQDAYETAATEESRLTGVTNPSNAQAVGYEAVEAYLSGPLDNLYVQRYCSASEKAAVTALVQRILQGYGVMLEGEDWLSAETRQRAQMKLSAMTVRVAYPDKLTDYSGLGFTSAADGGSLLTAVKTCARFELSTLQKKVNGFVDHNEWGMPASTVNSFYNPRDNSINILAGMLGGPVYSEDAGPEQNLAGIGMIIAHEITHAFDNQGALYDENGAYRSWWTDADYTSFRARAQKVADYYSGIVPFEGFGNYNGAQVVSEAIADLGAMKCTLGIAQGTYGVPLAGSGADGNFDYDKFFRAYATVWRGIRSSQTEYLYARNDTHPLYYLRVNVTLQQFDLFQSTYGIQPGDGMYLAPAERLGVW